MKFSSLSILFSTKVAKILAIFYLILFLWWISIYERGIQETNENFFYSLVYGLIPLFWGIYSLYLAHKWGGFKSSMGRSVAFLSAGMLTWAIGNLIWGYYNLILRIAIPYPSIADGIFILSFPLWVIGVIFLSRATGMYFSLRRLQGKIILFLIPFVAIIFSYYLLFIIARGGQFDFEGGITKLFLDIAFPVWDVIILTFSLLVYGLSFDYLGGKFKLPIIIILFSFGLNYITDFSFSYTTTLGTFYVGNWVDLMFTTTLFVMALGISSLDPHLLSDKKLSKEF